MADVEAYHSGIGNPCGYHGFYSPNRDYAAHITFRGLTFAYSDWNLAEVDGSHGNATVQGCTYMNKSEHRKLARRYVPFL